MNKEINKRQIKTTEASRRNIIAENREIFQELRERKKDVKEVKRFLGDRKSDALVKQTAAKKGVKIVAN